MENLENHLCLASQVVGLLLLLLLLFTVWGGELEEKKLRFRLKYLGKGTR